MSRELEEHGIEACDEFETLRRLVTSRKVRLDLIVLSTDILYLYILPLGLYTSIIPL